MKRARLLALAALAAAASPGLAHGDFRGPRVTTARYAAPPAISVVNVDLSAVARGVVPAVFDDNKRPPVLGEAVDLPDLQITPNTPSDALHAKLRKVDEWYAVRLLPAPGAYGQINYANTFSQIAYPSHELAANCNNFAHAAYGFPTRAVRWERFSLGAGPDATLEVIDGWFDPKLCKVAGARRTSVRLTPLIVEQGTPVAFGLRTDDALTVFFPPTMQIAVDANTGAPPAVHYGALTRVTLPIKKGMATTLLAEAQQAQLLQWKTSASPKVDGAAAPLAPTPARPHPELDTITIGLDILQTVSDDAPTAVARIQTRAP